MKKILIWLLIIGLLGFVLFLSFPIFVLVFIGCMANNNPPQLRSPVEQNLDFINSQLEYLYFANDKHSDSYDLYIGSIDGKSNNLISNNADIAYYYNSDRDKITFITDKKDKVKSYIKVYNLKNKKIEDTFEIDRQKYNGRTFSAPQFSPDSTKLLYTISDKNYHDYVFIINLVDKSNKMAFNTEYEMYGQARWDINNTDIWIYKYRTRDNLQHFFKYINPLNSKQFIEYTNFDDVSMAKIFGYISCWTKTTPFENRNDSEFVLKGGGKVLIKYHPGIGIDSTFNIDDFDYTKDMQYLIFTIGSKIYICDIKTGKIGYLAEGHYPRLIGENSSINKPIKSFYELGY